MAIAPGCNLHMHDRQERSRNALNSNDSVTASSATVGSILHRDMQRTPGARDESPGELELCTTCINKKTISTKKPTTTTPRSKLLSNVQPEETKTMVNGAEVENKSTTRHSAGSRIA